jgi:hypothetical protein
MREEKTMKNMLIAALAVILAAATPALSMGRQPSPEAVIIEVVSDSGNIFQSIPYDDFWKGDTHVFKKYLEARNGEKYGIIIRNRTTERVGIVIAVDGRNIISGKQSNLGKNEMMYIVNAGETTRLDGWRTSQDQVHRFYFTDASDSYTVKTFGDSSALGVIAAAVYKGKPQPQPRLKQKREAPAVGAPGEKESKSADRALASENAGTGFGEAQYSPVITVQFEPERTPAQKTLVKYEWRDVLCRKGILQCGRQLGNRLWDENRYAPYPPEYPKN